MRYYALLTLRPLVVVICPAIYSVMYSTISVHESPAWHHYVRRVELLEGPTRAVVCKEWVDKAFTLCALSFDDIRRDKEM
ncbi:hypothetical protein Tco_1438230 [Tanacetum coccineum]